VYVLQCMSQCVVGSCVAVGSSYMCCSVCVAVCVLQCMSQCVVGSCVAVGSSHMCCSVSR